MCTKLVWISEKITMEDMEDVKKRITKKNIKKIIEYFQKIKPLNDDTRRKKRV